MKLDYGSGNQPLVGFKSSDYTGTPNYDFYIEDYVVQELEDNSCDYLHCRNVLHHIPECDLPLVFGEFKRLLRPTGTLIISEPRPEHHLQNKILDIIWYRFLIRNNNIMIPDKYVDYKQYLSDFEIVYTLDEYNNEVLLLQLRSDDNETYSTRD